jgi:O-antigen/teichoic acid export membrane protein
MVGITFLALLLTQVDKIILSRMLSLTEYGYYALAATVASCVPLLILPISQAWFPRLCELHMQGNEKSLIEFYHTGAQLVTMVGGGVAVVLILLAEPFLLLWTRNAELANRVAPLLRLLLAGNLLNGLMHIPYQTQLAHGWTGLTNRINLVSVLLIVPAILWATPRYGTEGVAWVWVVLNSGYVLIGVHFMYRRILATEKWNWYRHDIFLPITACLAAALLMKNVWQATGITNTGVLLIVVSVAAFGASFAFSGRLVTAAKKLAGKILS